MKKYLAILCVAFISLVSCEEDPIIYDSSNGQTLAQFTAETASLPTPEDGASTQLTVLVSTKSDVERSITVEVDESSTASADQYAISNLVIPAGSFSGIITISSNFDAIPEQGSTYLVLNLTGIQNSETVVEKSTYTLELFRKCPIVLEDLVGTWSGPGSWGDTSLDYTTEVTTFLNEDGDLMINGLAFQWFTGWWSEVIITNEAVKMEVDVETGAITIPDQFYITSTYNGAPQTPYNLRGTGTILNACEKTMEIYPVFNQGGSVFDGTAWGPKFKETIQLVQ
tara:strand:- start:3606 stop:4454 length:849 start_codon:yes stop_codon:yes gene_type:complete